MLFWTNRINKVIRNNKLPDSLKLSHITTIYKKIDPSGKACYRLVRVLPVLSKVFGKIIFDIFMDIWKNFWVICSLIFAKQIPHKIFFSGYFRNGMQSLTTVLMYFSKAYCCLWYGLLFENLEEYVFDIGSSDFELDYLSLEKHRTKAGSSYNKWSETCQGIPQGSILVSLFLTYLSAIFTFL